MKLATGATSKFDFRPAYRLVSVCCLVVATCLLAITVEAHDPGLSALNFRIDGVHLTANVTFARADLEAVIATQEMSDDARGKQACDAESLTALALRALEIEMNKRRIDADSVAAELDQSTGAVHFRIEYSVKAGAQLAVRSRLIDIFPRGHRQYVSINDERGNLLGERMLDVGNETFEISLAEAAPAPVIGSVRRFLILGVEHILTGYDHLFFLLGLMIVSASFRAVARIITSFTLAHSITLAVATLGVVRISPGAIEPLIAASIVYVGLENIFRRDLSRRWLLTFGFGLAHGFGFASALRELGIGEMSAAVPLLSFNLGVELGQVAIAAVALPLIWKIREKPMYKARYLPALSLLISLGGGFWLIERTLPR